MGTLLDTLRAAEEAEGATYRTMEEFRKARDVALERWQKARRQGYSTEERHHEAYERRSADTDLWLERTAQAQAATQAAEQALIAAREARWLRREARLNVDLGLLNLASAPNADVRLQVRPARPWRGRAWEGGRYTLTLVERVYSLGADDGQMRERHGCSVEVYGPEHRVAGVDPETREWRYEWRDAQVNWPTIGAMSVTQARDQMRLHGLAITLAEYLDLLREEWRAEDLDD